MAQVFTGKVIIPGDKMEEYFQVMAAAEKARKPFKEYLQSLNQEFTAYLTKKFTARTASKHTNIVWLFTEFLTGYTDVQSLDEVTRGMVNTHFRSWYNRKVLDSATPDELRVALHKFFLFLSTEKGIINEKVLDALE